MAPRMQNGILGVPYDFFYCLYAQGQNALCLNIATIGNVL